MRGLQHHINNPCAVIVLSMEDARKAALGNNAVIFQLSFAEQSVDRIQAALSGFQKPDNTRLNQLAHIAVKWYHSKRLLILHNKNDFIHT